MRVSQEWLSEFIELSDLTPREIAERLTVSGTEVEGVEQRGGGLEGVLVAHVVRVDGMAGSPNRLALVRVPGREPVEVVCGAPNLFQGAAVAWAPPGCELPSGVRIGERRIGGVVSTGMLCAPDELGLGSDHDGLLLLPQGEAEPGSPLSQVFPPDTVYELEVLSHRADCLSHLGVARELAAVLDRPLREPERLSPERRGAPAQAEVQVSIEEGAGCQIYRAELLEGVEGHSTPLWIQRRLLAVGEHSISPVVDLANYVMLEVGQPVHTFDADRLGPEGRVELAVRRARAGEALDCLDGVERHLSQDDLVITAQDRPVALAGVIGGRRSAVSEGTRRVLLEVASFDWVAVRRTSRRLGLRTEASARFERRLAAPLVPLGAGRFLHLAHQVLGAEVRPGPVEAGELPAAAAPIRTSAERISRLLGLEVGSEEAASLLRRLDFQVRREGETLEVVPSPLRTDVHIEEDLTEEVGRVLGYERLPATLPPIRGLPPPPAATPAARLAAEICIGAGFDEALTLSLVSAAQAGQGSGLGRGKGTLNLSNPLSPELAELRASLLPGLLQACRLNQGRGLGRARLFEWGRVFWAAPDGDRPFVEPEVLALVDHDPDPPADPGGSRLDRLLQVVQALGERLGAAAVTLRPVDEVGYQIGRCAEVLVAGERRGVLGQLLPQGPALELRGAVLAAELRVDGWLFAGGRPPRGVDLAKTPPLSLDLAVVVPEGAQLGPARAAVARAGIGELEEIRLVDRYSGERLGQGREGWTFRLTFRDPERTLTHADGRRLRARVLAALSEVGATERETSP